MIDDFRGHYFFLSNFSPSPIKHGGILFPTVEHAYQAGKIMDMQIRVSLADCPTPGDAKRFGRKMQMRPDWDAVKVQRMSTCLIKKFRDPLLRQRLLDTGSELLIEGNDWDDNFWGATDYSVEGKIFTGHNILGQLLMAHRLEIRNGYRIPGD